MEEKLLKIINHYGVNHQQRKLAEEIFELNEAIIRYEFASGDNATLEILEEMRKWDLLKFKQHITEELADVMVMLCQFKEYYGIDGNEIMRIMNEKIDRQLKRINED